METSGLLTTACLCLLAVTCTHAIILGDFLSIDCGGNKDSEDKRGLQWVTDDAFIKTGTKLVIEDSPSVYSTLRYFTEDRGKNCYEVPVKNDTLYLVRAYFDPGNVTLGRAISSPVDFTVTVNSNVWLNYSSPSEDLRPAGQTEVVVHTLDDNELHICLLKGENGYPFINTLELREFNESCYTVVKDNRLFLRLNERYNTGSNGSAIVRYPDDFFDRIWYPTPASFPTYRTVTNTSLPPERLDVGWSIYNWPPVKVFEDAWVGDDLATPVFFPSSDKVYVWFYIREIRPLNNTDLEVDPVGMILGVSDQTTDVNITDLSVDHYYVSADVSPKSNFSVTVRSQLWSKRQAILNAFEIYDAVDHNTSRTYKRDRNALSALKESFGLTDWQGDPCYPVAWSWVTCNELARVDTLQLSHLNISGSIPENISAMSYLREIYLNDNNLTGSIPQALESLTRLQVLNLSNNDLKGQIPPGLLNNTALNFMYDGNPDLCTLSTPNCEPLPPSPAPVEQSPVPAAAAASTLKLFATAVTFLSFCFLV